ncbi:unnamed protein product [Diatraea saccharalis]|uniref:Uncharacterized protein n=1 Tax=Diatraea saccharalis TaxID=40085 RepID=A0A9N9WG10_9NEOP|nr:unnamed protein product [Diatraea saccharalis]
MANVATVIETQKSLESALMHRMKEFEDKLKSSSSNKDKVPQLEEEFKSFKEIVWSVVSLLRQQINEVLRTVDQLESRHRSKHLLFCGVPEEPNEDLKTAVTTLLRKHLGIREIEPSSIKLCHLLGAPAVGRSRPVVFRFFNSNLRATVWKLKTKLKGSSLVLKEFLTKPREAVFHAAPSHFGIPNVWSADGNIFVKTPDGHRLRVVCSDELDTIVRQYPSLRLLLVKHQLYLVRCRQDQDVL